MSKSCDNCGVTGRARSGICFSCDGKYTKTETIPSYVWVVSGWVDTEAITILAVFLHQPTEDEVLSVAEGSGFEEITKSQYPEGCRSWRIDPARVTHISLDRVVAR